jgi:hypothetical protein
MADINQNQLITIVLGPENFRPYDSEYNDDRILIISVAQL